MQRLDAETWKRRFKRLTEMTLQQSARRDFVRMPR